MEEQKKGVSPSLVSRVLRRSIERKSKAVSDGQQNGHVANGKDTSQDKPVASSSHEVGEDNFAVPHSVAGDGPSFSTAAGKRVHVSESSLKRAADLLNDSHPEEDLVAGGFFSSARGKVLRPSAESLKRAAAILEDDGISGVGVGVEEITSGPQLEGSMRGAAKKVRGSTYSGEDDRVHKDEEDEEQITPGKQSGSVVFDKGPNSDDNLVTPRLKSHEDDFVGFSTGKGKRVAVSEQSMKKATAMLADDDEMGSAPTPSFQGFATGKGKAVSVSEQSMKKASAMLADDEFVETPARSGESESFSGFSTGKGKAVRPSAQSLKLAAAKMEEEDNPGPAGSSDLVGFSTGKGTRVSISQDKLREAQKRMEEDAEPTNDNVVSLKKQKLDEQDNEFVHNVRKADEVSRKLEFGVSSSSSVPVVAAAQPPVAPPVSTPKSVLKVHSEAESSSKLSRVERTPLYSSKNSGASTSTTKKTPMTKPYQAPSRKPVAVSAGGSGAGGKPKDTTATTTPVSIVKTSQQEMKDVSVTTPVQPKRNGTKMFDLVLSPRKRVTLQEFGSSRTLKLFSEEEYRNFGVNPSTLVITSETAASLKFDRGMVGPETLKKKLVEAGADPNLLTIEWVENHYGLINWKLASMERAFPAELGGVYLNKNTVLKQLKYRYEREINQAQRPILRKVVERDDASTRYMVLVVTRIIDLGEDSDPSAVVSTGVEDPDAEDRAALAMLASYATIEVSDGWYKIPAKLDSKLTEHLAMGRIFPGLKIKVFGARLQGVTEACPPLELPAGAFLALSVNGCRRASWHSRLGLRQKPGFPVGIRTVKPGGGTVPRLDVVILRRMPLLFLERTKGATKWTTHNERTESQRQEDIQMGMESELRKKQEEIEKMFESEDQDRRATASKIQKHMIPFIRNEEDLIGLYLLSNSVCEVFSTEQNQLLQSALSRMEQERAETVAKESSLVSETVMGCREVIPFVELEIADCPEAEPTDLSKVAVATIQVFSPAQDLLEEVLLEGSILSVYGVETSRWRPEEGEKPRLRSGKFTSWKRREGPVPPYPAFDSIYKPRCTRRLEELQGVQSESTLFDWAGCLLQVAPTVLGDGSSVYFFCDGSGDGQVLALEAPPFFRFGVTSDVGSELQTVWLKNIMYRRFDEVNKIHLASASVKSEALFKLPSALSEKVFASMDKIVDANNRMKTVAAGIAAPLWRSRVLGDENALLCVQGTIQPFHHVVRTTLGSACVPSPRDVLAQKQDEVVLCHVCQVGIVEKDCCSNLEQILLCIDDGIDSYLCCVDIKYLSLMLLNSKSSACEDLSSWVRKFLRTGKCGRVEASPVQIEERCDALKQIQAGEFANLAVAVVTLLNCIRGTDNETCKHDEQTKTRQIPRGVKFTQAERDDFLYHLWQAFSSQRWTFTLKRSTQSSDPWRVLYQVDLCRPLSALNEASRNLFSCLQ